MCRNNFLLYIVVGISLAIGALGDPISASAELAQADPYVGTERYNTFPWTFEADYAYVLGVSPLFKPPTNPSAWSTAPGLLQGFVGGPGMLVLIRYTDSPIGEYSELFYSPGGYKSIYCPYEKQLSSVQRIWVSSPYSQRAGRNIWGIPKEIATFDWQETTPGTVTVTVNNTSGKTFFKTTLTKTPLSKSFVSVASNIAQAFVGNCMEVLQWPIDDNTQNSTNARFAGTPVFKTSQAAAAKKPFTPVKSPVCFNIKDGNVANIDSAFMDAETFTGRRFDKVHVLGPFGYRLPAAINGSLGVPRALKCWK